MGRDHVIEQGESVIDLAVDYGLAPDTIWDDPANATLKTKRRSMSVLLPKDVVVIPDKRPKQADAPTGERTVFRRKGIPGKLRMQLFENDLPRVEEDYRLTVDGELVSESKTDKDGFFETFVPTGATEGVLVVGPDEVELQLAFGHLDPHDEVSGLQKRLNNLGFDCGEPDGELGDQTRSALRQFQERHPDLEPSGELDSATTDALASLHDEPGEMPDVDELRYY